MSCHGIMRAYAPCVRSRARASKTARLRARESQLSYCVTGRSLYYNAVVQEYLVLENPEFSPAEQAPKASKAKYVDNLCTMFASKYLVLG